MKTENNNYVPDILVDISCNQNINGEISLLKSILNREDTSVIFDVGATRSTFPLYSNTCQFHMFDPDFEFEKNVNYYTENCVVNKMALDSKENTIDSYCKKHDIKKIDFLKIDTDGRDLDVLKGALNILPCINHIQIEHDMFYLLRKQNTSEFYEILKDFKLYKITHNGLKKVDKIKEDYLYSNYLFTRDDSFLNYEPLKKNLDFFKGVFWEIDPRIIENNYYNTQNPFYPNEVTMNIDEFLSKYYYNYIKSFCH